MGAVAVRHVRAEAKASDGVATAGPWCVRHLGGRELSGLHPQTLRIYEREGLVEPGRSAGGTRLYSGDDVTRLREIAALIDGGLNIAGIKRVLQLQDEVRRLQAEVERLSAEAEEPTPDKPVSRRGARPLRTMVQQVYLDHLTQIAAPVGRERPEQHHAGVAVLDLKWISGRGPCGR